MENIHSLYASKKAFNDKEIVLNLLFPFNQISLSLI